MQELTTATLDELEARIDRGLKTFVDVGAALLEIRDARLYRQRGYERFEDYCQERFRMSRYYAHRTIEAAKVVSMLPIGNVPMNEAQTRELAPLRDDPETMRQAWDAANEATGGKPTAAAVREAVKAFCSPPTHAEAPAPDQPAPAKEWAAQDEAPAEDAASPDEPTVLHVVTKPHVSHNSGNNEWYTPSSIIEAARAAMGEIDLDPASSELANGVVKAANYYDVADNGLVQPWYGRVWLNPPYGQPLIAQFCDRLVEHVQNDAIDQAIALTNNATETAWFQALLRECNAVCFVRGRIRYWSPSRESASPLQGQAVLYFGPYADDFAEHFAEFGEVMHRE